MLAGIELGGTKAVLVRGAPGAIAERVELPTGGGAAMLAQAAAVLDDWRSAHVVEALGIASFGPVRIDPAAADFGTIQPTPKPGWSGADLVARLAAPLGLPFALDTDVNAAALAERALGAAQGCDTVAYVTLGTGVGVGIVVEGRTVRGALHPEGGHIRLRRQPGDTFAGACAVHGDCGEGLVAGPALAARFGCPPGEIAPGDPRWAIVAGDLAELLAALLLTLSAQKIVVGGGVATRQPHLLPLARARVPALLGGYIGPGDFSERIAPAALGNDAGPTGALLLARDALTRAVRTA